MIWSFIAICLSTWLFVDASYRGPRWQRFLFQSVTLLLLLLLAWQAPPMVNITKYLVFAGLLASLIGNILILLSHQLLQYSIGSFFLSYLFYSIYFSSQITLSFFWPLLLSLLIIGILLASVIWTKAEEIRWFIFTFIFMTIVMVWLSGEDWLFRSTIPSMFAFFGSGMLLIGTIVWLISHYRYRIRADQAIIAACYYSGHFFIIRSLYNI